MAIEETVASHESRIVRLEEAFQQVAMAIKQLTDLATTTDGRLDSAEETSVHTDARLDALIDSQIQLTQRVDTLTVAQLKTDEQIGALNARTDNRLDALINAQIRTDEQLAKLGAHVEDLTVHTKESLTQLETFIAETARQVRALIGGRNGNESKSTQ